MRETTYIPGLGDVPMVPLDASVGWGKEPMARFLRALVWAKGAITDSYCLAPPTKPSDTVFFRVFIPEPYILRFTDEAKCQDLRPAPRVRL